MKVGVALSGGIDSAVSLYLLKQQNFELFGITIKLTDDYEDTPNGAINRSKMLCDKFSIEHITLDWRNEFKKEIIDKFKTDIVSGLTPVPCIRCNKLIKIGKLADFCYQRNAKLATGHYATINNGRIFMAKDKLKDQTHFLCSIDKCFLNNLIFPIGEKLKSEVFRIAMKEKLVNVVNYQESQDVCFFNGKSYNDYLKLLAINEECGDIVHIENNLKLGIHNGLLKYTIGQRKGLGVAWKEPLYVIQRDFKKNILFVGEEHLLYSKEVNIKNINILVEEFQNIKEFTCNVCLRDKTPMVFGNVYIKNNKTAKIILKNPARAITYGQWCAFYVNDMLIGGGEICNET